MIERIRIRNYRSLHDVDVRLEPLTVLIGRSGSGKSNFVRAIRMLRDVLAGQDLSQVANNAPFEGGTDGLMYAADLNVLGVGQIAYTLVFSHQHKSQVADESLRVNDRVLFSQSKNSWITKPTVVPIPATGQIILEPIP